jgi:hypothetical protein
MGRGVLRGQGEFKKFKNYIWGLGPPAAKNVIFSADESPNMKK